MVSLERKIRAEIENVIYTLKEMPNLLLVEEKTFPELAAMATILQNVYNGMENILKQILKEKKVPLQKSDTWHKDILESCGEQKIISDEMKNILYEFLLFRHFFVHGYAIRIEEARLLPLAENIRATWERFLFEIKPYYEFSQ